MNIGDKVKLSSLKKSDVGRMEQTELIFIVSRRWASGGTTVVYDCGDISTFIHDIDDPDVIFLGTGKITIEIEGNALNKAIEKCREWRLSNKEVEELLK